MIEEFNKVLLMLGGNLGEEQQLFQEARNFLKEHIGAEIKASSLYRSEPWGLKSQPWFVNQALIYHSPLAPDQILNAVLEIELKMGRKRSGKNSPRNIDIDVLLYGNEIVSTPRLVIPHPRMHLRKFNLLPASEICPDWVHPLCQQRISELLARSDDKLEVRKIDELHVKS
jgi:2-amino-4-hydroxy-6-hydroxymethyldihydropteridine diphosphokinase